MNIEETTKQKIVDNLDKVFDSLMKATEVTADFAAAEVPLLLKEIITFNAASSAFYAVLSSVILWGLAFKLLIPTLKKPDDYFDLKMVVGIFGGATALSCLCIIVFYTEMFMKVMLAPRLFILEFITGLVR